MDITHMQRIISKLSRRFRWTFHNIVAHPVSEILFQLNLYDASVFVHDSTIPASERNNDHN
jgi:hypothetical protein